MAFKNLYVGFWGLLGGGTPKLCQNICLLNAVPTDIKQKTGSLALTIPKLLFRTPFWAFLRGWSQKILGDKIAFAAPQLYKKIIHFGVLCLKKKSVED